MCFHPQRPDCRFTRARLFTNGLMRLTRLPRVIQPNLRRYTIVLKGLKWGRVGFDERPVRNVHVHDLVIWYDWGRALEIGA